MNDNVNRPARTRNASQAIAEILSDMLEEKLSKAHGDDIRVADGSGAAGVTCMEESSYEKNYRARTYHP